MSKERTTPSFTEEQLELLAASEEDLRAKSDIPCFDLRKVGDRIRDGEKWQQLMQAHLYYDHVLTQMLADELKHPDAINLKRMGFSQKVRLIFAMGLLPQRLVTQIEFVNNLRNKIAHDLNFEISDEIVADLTKHVGTDWIPDERETLKFNEMLLIILAWTEGHRKEHAYRRLSTKKAYLNARRVYYEIGDVLKDTETDQRTTAK